MGVMLRGRTYHLKKRVPRRFAHLDPRGWVYVSLHTDSRREAAAKAQAVEAELSAYWEALEAGETPDALARHQAARKLARARGIVYRPIEEMLARPDAVEELLARLAPLASPDHVAPRAEVEAMLGVAPEPALTVTKALAQFFELTPDRVAGKSDAQVRRWRYDKERAVRNFLEAVGDKPLAEITSADAIAYRTVWQDKLARTGQSPDSANKDFGHLSDVFRTVSELLALDLANPFANMRLKRPARRTEVPPFSTKWIREKLLALGALDGLNEEARLALLVMVNTGARPSEILGAEALEFKVDAKVPHLAIRPGEGRALKTAQFERDVPLAGVSLEAARRLRALGGCVRYRGKADRWSAAVNKFLGANGLRETPAHRTYSLRHAFEDRLLEAGVDGRLRAELMGHKYNRPAYGRGGSLELKADAVAQIAV